MSSEHLILAAVEGPTDEVVIRRLIKEAGAATGTVYGRNGKSVLREKIDAYNKAACRFPWVVLVDLDQDYGCAPSLRSSWIPNPAPWMCFRIAVREVEAWLLADAERLSRFLSVPLAKFPHSPEELDHPKRIMVELAQYSRRYDIKRDMVPRVNSGRLTGPAYASRLIEFVSHPEFGWRPTVAAKRSDSLRRSLDCLHGLIGKFPWLGTR